MGMFSEVINVKIKKLGIIVKDKLHYEELYSKFRDEIFIRKTGKTFQQWKDDYSLQEKE